MYRVNLDAIESGLMDEIITHYAQAQQGEGDNYAKDETYTKMVHSDFFYEHSPLGSRWSTPLKQPHRLSSIDNSWAMRSPRATNRRLR